MPYIGGKLTDLVDAFAEVTPLFARSMADTGSDFLLERARAYTPIGTGRDGGHVHSAWEKVEVERAGHGSFVAYVGGARNRHYRIGWLEYGTEPHAIRPDDEQAITTPEGPRAGAQHPGTRGHHMAARAAQDLEVHGDELLAPDLRAWADAAEANARRRRGII